MLNRMSVFRFVKAEMMKFTNNIWDEICKVFTPQPLRAVRVLFSPMVSRWAVGRAGGKKVVLYLRNCEV